VDGEALTMYKERLQPSEPESSPARCDGRAVCRLERKSKKKERIDTLVGSFGEGHWRVDGKEDTPGALVRSLEQQRGEEGGVQSRGRVVPSFLLSSLYNTQPISLSA
jgi:hypothetical protein